MIFHRVLDQVFSTWSHVAVLRVLQDAAHGLSGREIARLSSMSHRSCLKALTNLEELHLLTRQRGGRDHLFTLNRNHVLVSDALLPLLRVEREFPGLLETFLKEQLRRQAANVILFGSVVRRQETVRSDLDVCILVHKESEKDRVQEYVHSLAPVVQQRFGARLAPILFTTVEFVKGVKAKKSPMTEIVKGGKVITGRSLRGLARG